MSKQELIKDLKELIEQTRELMFKYVDKDGWNEEAVALNRQLTQQINQLIELEEGGE